MHHMSIWGTDWEWNSHAHVQNAFSQTTQMFVHSRILIMFCRQNAMDAPILSWCAEQLQENERHNHNSQELKLTSCASCLTKTQITYTTAKEEGNADEDNQRRKYILAVFLVWVVIAVLFQCSHQYIFTFSPFCSVCYQLVLLHGGRNLIIRKTLNHRKLSQNKLDEVQTAMRTEKFWPNNFCQKTLFHIKLLIFNGRFDTAHNTLLTHFQS